MNTKFNCPYCNAAVEAESHQIGLAGECPACKELLVVPGAQRRTSPTTTISTNLPATVQEPSKSAEDYAVDALCATAKAGWKATKVIAPIIGRIAFKVTGRAAKAAASTKAGKTVIDGAKWLAEPPAKPPSKLEQTHRTIYQIWRLFGG